MNKSIDVLSEEIDDLLLRKFELMEEKICKNIQMETLLKDGHIELAKAKYIRGKESFSILQIPNNQDAMSSLFDLETKIMDKFENSTPCFDISLKKSNNEVDNLIDPIKWFGVLVPQNLRKSQKRFQECIYLAAKIANTQVELISVISKLEKLYIEKHNLCYPNNIKT